LALQAQQQNLREDRQLLGLDPDDPHRADPASRPTAAAAPGGAGFRPRDRAGTAANQPSLMQISPTQQPSFGRGLQGGLVRVRTGGFERVGGVLVGAHPPAACKRRAPRGFPGDVPADVVTGRVRTDVICCSRCCSRSRCRHRGCPITPAFHVPTAARPLFDNHLKAIFDPPSCPARFPLSVHFPHRCRPIPGP
jgi:hypothetical protein